MRSIVRWWLIASVVSALTVGVCVLLWPKEDPRELVLGEWREQSMRVRVEVLPGAAKWRGMGHGTLRYEWLQTENSPYRALLKRRDRSVQVNVRFVDRDSMIVEPDIWEMLPENAREMLSDINLRHGRPEKEFRLLLRREEESK